MNVKKQGNSWYYDFRYDGKRYRKGGFKTKREAQATAIEVKASLSKGFNLTDKTPFVEYYNKYVEINKEGKISDKHLARYKNSIKVFEEKFGMMPVNKLTKMMYQELLNEYAEGKFLEPKENGRATASVEKLHYCLREAIKEALHEGIIHKDPTYKAVTKGLKKAKLEDDKFMSLEEFKALKRFAMSKKELSYLFLYMLVVTGARFSEVQHIKITDINKKDKTIHIRGTKTENADRVIKVSEKDINYILNFIKVRPLNINGYLFDTGFNLISHNSVSRLFKTFLLKNKCNDYTLHSIRHTHISWLIDLGFDIYYISKRAGHANISITQEIYGHLLPETEKENDIKMEQSLSAI